MGRKKENSNEHSKMGTWFGVGVLGVTILITYFILLGLYMDRL